MVVRESNSGCKLESTEPKREVTIEIDLVARLAFRILEGPPTDRFETENSFRDRTCSGDENLREID